MVIAELEVELDLLRRATRYLEEQWRRGRRWPGFMRTSDQWSPFF
jgi:hypothetical protein